MRYILITLLVLGFGHASARPITNAEKTALEATVAEFTDALDEKDMMRVLRIGPIRVFEFLAAGSNYSADDIVNQAKELLENSFTDTYIKYDNFNIDNISLTDAIHPDGTVIVFGLIRTTLDMEVNGIFYRDETELLALSEDGVWYLLQLEEPSTVLLLQKIYPFLSDLTTARTTSSN